MSFTLDGPKKPISYYFKPTTEKDPHMICVRSTIEDRLDKYLLPAPKRWSPRPIFNPYITHLMYISTTHWRTRALFEQFHNMSPEKKLCITNRESGSLDLPFLPIKWSSQSASPGWGALHTALAGFCVLVRLQGLAFDMGIGITGILERLPPIPSFVVLGHLWLLH